jgi:hypothetical protein
MKRDTASLRVADVAERSVAIICDAGVGGSEGKVRSDSRNELRRNNTEHPIR